MSGPTGVALALLLPLLAPAVHLPAPDGRTLWLDASLAGAGHELEVRPTWGPGWVLIELDGPDEHDLDLVVAPAGDAPEQTPADLAGGAPGRASDEPSSRAAGERPLGMRRTKQEPRRASSHAGDELLLVRVEDALLVRVVAASPAAAGARFRLGLTPLVLDGALDPAAPRTLAGVLDGQGGADAAAPRAQLVELGAWSWSAARLHARRTEGAGDVDLAVFDGGLDLLVLGLDDGPDERCQPAAGAPREEQGAPRFALLLARGGPLSYELRVERPPPGQKSFPPSRLERFLGELASTPEQRLALEALRRTPDFVRLRCYVDGYPGGLPLRLRAVPGLRAGGVERFGTYHRGTLTINPTIAAHRDNAQELLDTLVHELIHALLDLPRGPRFPLAPDVLDAVHDPRLEEIEGLPIRRGRAPGPLGRYLDDHYGPSASDPTRDYSDINAGAQRLIVKVIEETLHRTGLGHETIVFDSVRARGRASPSEPERARASPSEPERARASPSEPERARASPSEPE